MTNENNILTTFIVSFVLFIYLSELYLQYLYFLFSDENPEILP